MQFLFENDSNLYGYSGGGQKGFEFPSNVKQMGCIDDSIKIYVEDYVYTYLYQYAKSGGGQEKIAALVGKHQIIDGREVVVISGAIQGKGTKVNKGVLSFTDETWQYINSQMDVYFKDFEVLGWMHTQPGFGAFLMSRDEIFHKENFKQAYHLLFVMDPLEKIDTFYVYNEHFNMHGAKGYFIYYDNKNVEMQDYMIETNTPTPTEEGNFEELNSSTEDKPETNRRIDAAPKIRKVLKEKEEAAEAQKSRFAMLTGVCGVLCVACAIMGVSLLSSQTRLSNLETEVTKVRTSYVALTEQITNGSVTSVFASQNEKEQPIVQEEPKVQEEVKAEVTEPEPTVPVEAPTETPTPEPTEPAPPAEVTEPSEPKEEVKAEPVGETNYYTVEDGDNLSYISYKFYGTRTMMDSIMEANNMSDPDKLQAGKKIILP